MILNNSTLQFKELESHATKGGKQQEAERIENKIKTGKTEFWDAFFVSHKQHRILREILTNREKSSK